MTLEDAKATIKAEGFKVGVAWETAETIYAESVECMKTRTSCGLVSRMIVNHHRHPGWPERTMVARA